MVSQSVKTDWCILLSGVHIVERWQSRQSKLNFKITEDQVISSKENPFDFDPFDLMTPSSEYAVNYKVHAIDVNYERSTPFKKLFSHLFLSEKKAKKNTKQNTPVIFLQGYMNEYILLHTWI